MKISDLIRELNTYLTESGDLEVILQKDAEGNDYSPLEGVFGPHKYRAESTWSGEIIDEEDEENEEEEFREDSSNDIDVVLLVPVN